MNINDLFQKHKKMYQPQTELYLFYFIILVICTLYNQLNKIIYYQIFFENLSFSVLEVYKVYIFLNFMYRRH